MSVALTGTPGVGKTTVAKVLRDMDYEILDLNSYIEKKNLSNEKDTKRDSFEVDIDELKEMFEVDELRDDIDIVEGHLSHHLKLQKTIVLRCSPPDLRKRMENKGWPERKIKENLEAEILDSILIQASRKNEEIYEIDTTEKKPKEVAEKIDNILKENSDNYKPGSVDWTEYLSEMR